MAAKKPSVLIIDDRLDEARFGENTLKGVGKVRVRAPDDVTEADLVGSSVVLIDHRLEDWPGRDSLESVCLKPQDGVALAGVLRSHLERHHGDTPVAFALYSGQLSDLTPSRGPLLREHTIARLTNLEWVFAKKQTPRGVTFPEQVAALALAMAELAAKRVSSQPEATWSLRKLLSTPPSSRWVNRAMEDVEECHPPYRDLATDSRGLSIVRWLLHRVLPYPCFLLDERYLAVRLRVALPSLRAALSGDERFRRKLGSVGYSGILAGFLGRRWWRAGVDALVWNLTGGDPFAPDALRKAVTSKLSKTLRPLRVVDPVVTLDEHLSPTDDVAELAECVEVQPDDWPPYAERAWLRIEDAAGDQLASALVMSRDKARLIKHRKSASHQ